MGDEHAHGKRGSKKGHARRRSGKEHSGHPEESREEVCGPRSGGQASGEENEGASTMVPATGKALELRPYQAKDFERMIDLIVEHVPKLPNYRKLKTDRKRIEYVLRHNIDNAAAFGCWVLCDTHDVVQGGVGGFCVMSLLSLDLIADDIFLFVVPEYRTLHNANQLIQVYKEWAQARGAVLIRASYSGGSFPPGTKEYEAFNMLLRRQGFVPVGTIYHYEPEN